MALAFDLQAHSLHSDGELTVSGVIEHAARAGVGLLALSDHDTIDGVDEAIVAAQAAGIELVPACEISAVDGTGEDLHVLGYLIDHRDPVLAERLRAARDDRALRAEHMSRRLTELGFALDARALEERRAAGKPVGRPHLAAAVTAHPANRERLAHEDRLESSAFLGAYLVPGAPAYVARTGPTVREAIEWVAAAGGVSVWAHPFWDLECPEEVLAGLARYREFGLAGVEAFYPTHDAAQTELLATYCRKHGLLCTGSSDFHGPSHRLFDRFLAYCLHGQRPRLGPLGEGPGADALN